MNIRIDRAQAEKLGIRVPSTASNARARQSDLLDRARAKLDEITDDMPESRVKAIEKEYDALIAEYDQLDAYADREEGLAIRQAFIGEPDPRRPVGEDRTVSPHSDARDVAYALRPEQRMADYVARQKDVKPIEISTGKLLRALAVGPRDDAEKRALAEGTPSAGGYTVPDIVAAGLIDTARAASVVMQAGAMTVPLKSEQTTIAKVLTDPVPAWRSELGNVGTGDPTFGPVVFNARSLAVLVRVSEELLQDSLNIATELPLLIARAMAAEMDRVAIYGSGSDPEPEGVENFTGINSLASAALTSYDKFVDAKTEIRANNHNGNISHILHPRDWGALAKLADGEDQPLRVPEWISGDQWLTTTAATNDFSASPVGDSTVVSGDFAKLLIGMRQDVRLEILKERYRDTLEIGFLCHMRIDVAATYENAFTKFSATH